MLQYNIYKYCPGSTRPACKRIPFVCPFLTRWQHKVEICGMKWIFSFIPQITNLGYLETKESRIVFASDITRASGSVTGEKKLSLNPVTRITSRRGWTPRERRQHVRLCVFISFSLSPYINRARNNTYGASAETCRFPRLSHRGHYWNTARSEF